MNILQISSKSDLMVLRSDPKSKKVDDLKRNDYVNVSAWFFVVLVRFSLYTFGFPSFPYVLHRFLYIQI